MATDIERLIVQLSADIKGYENAMRKAQAATVSSTRGIERQFAVMQGRVGAGFSKLSRAYAGIFATAAAARGSQQLVDAATNIDNALKVAGLSGEALNNTYERLFQSAQKNAAPLEALVTLYSRISTSAKELGASQEEILKFTDTVALSLRASGSSAQAASGALLQLAQALGGSKIQAQEFNSLIDGARPLLQAVAFGLEEAGGSVAKLTQLVKNGEVSAKAFFRAGQAGAGVLEKQLGGTTFTITQRFGQLYNSLTNAARNFNNSSKVAETFGEELEDLSQFLDDFDWDGFVSGIQAANAAFQSGISDVRGWIAELSRITGLENIGKLITGGAAFTEHIPGFRVTSQAGLDDLFERNAGSFRELNEEERRAAEELRKAAADLSSAAEKQDRLSVTDTRDPNFGSVSLKDHPVTEAAEGLEKVLDDFVDRVIQAESGGDVTAKNPLSSATGLGQFIESTWLKLFRQHFPSEAKSMTDATILGLRNNADVSKRLIEEYARQNAEILQKAGVSVDAAALHLAHFLGPGGAAKVLTAAPGTPIAGLLDAAAIRANPTILGGGATVDDVRAYGQQRAFGGGEIERDIALRREQAQAIRELIEAGREDTARIQLETSLMGASTAAREREMFIFEQFLELKRQGVALTPEIVAGVEAEAAARFAAVQANDAAVQATDRLIQKQEELNNVQQEIGGAFQGAIKGLISDLIHGRDATEALTDAVARLADRLLDIALNQIFASLFGGGLGGGGGGLLGGFLGAFFKNGGIVQRRASGGMIRGQGGPRDDKVPVLASNGEFIVNSEATRRNRQLLEDINSGSGMSIPKMMRDGGMVSPSSSSALKVDNRTTIINRFDAAGVLSEALSQPEGVKVLLNVIQSQPGAFRQAVNG